LKFFLQDAFLGNEGGSEVSRLEKKLKKLGLGLDEE
jgi:hypothetical protein